MVEVEVAAMNVGSCVWEMHDTLLAPSPSVSNRSMHKEATLGNTTKTWLTVLVAQAKQELVPFHIYSMVEIAAIKIAIHCT